MHMRYQQGYIQQPTALGAGTPRKTNNNMGRLQRWNELNPWRRYGNQLPESWALQNKNSYFYNVARCKILSTEDMSRSTPPSHEDVQTL